jgi:hypothetical protein
MILAIAMSWNAAMLRAKLEPSSSIPTGPLSKAIAEQPCETFS